jgi:hypothetical protein
MLEHPEKNSENSNNTIETTESKSAFQTEYLSSAMSIDCAQRTPTTIKGLSKTDPCSPLNPPGKPEKIDSKIITGNLAQIAGQIDGTKFEYVYSAPLVNTKPKNENVRYYTAGQDKSAQGPDLHFANAKEEIGKNARELAITPEPVSGGSKWAIESYPETNPVDVNEYLVRSAQCELDENGEATPSLGDAINHKQYESKYHSSVKYYARFDENAQGQVVGVDLKREAFYHGDSGRKLADISYLGKDGKLTPPGKPASATYYDFDTQQKTAEVDFDARGIESKRVEFKSGKPSRTLEYYENRTVKKEIQHDYLGGILISNFDDKGNRNRRETQTAKGKTELLEEVIKPGQVNLSFFDPTTNALKPYAIAECKHNDKALTAQSIKLYDEKGRLRGSFDATKGESPFIVKPGAPIGVNMKFFDKKGNRVTGAKFEAMLKSAKFQGFAESLLKANK